MSNIRVTCPTCKTELEVDASHEGQEVECGNCLQVFIAQVPRPSGGGSRAGGKIPGAGASSRGRGRSEPERRPAKRRDDDDEDDDYEHDHRDDDYDDDYSPPPRRPAGEGDAVATTSLILGIFAIVLACCCWPISFPISLAATVTGALGLKSRNNKGAAVAGLVMGVLGLCLAGLILLLGMGNAVFNRFN